LTTILPAAVQNRALSHTTWMTRHRRYRRRLAYFAQNPLGPDWDGVFRAVAK